MSRRRLIFLALLALEAASLALVQVLQPEITTDPKKIRIEWSVGWGGSERDYADGVAAAGEDIYVTGTTIRNHYRDIHSFLLCYDPEGRLRWNQTYREASFGRGVAVYRDAVYVAGAAIVDEANVALLCKYSLDGRLAWSVKWMPETVARGVAASPWGDVYVAGYQRLSPLETRGILLSYKPDGSLNWAWQPEPEELSIAWSVAASDGVYVSGSDGARRVTLTKLSGGGAVEWSRSKALGEESDGFALDAGKEITQAGFVRYEDETSKALVVKYTPSGETRSISTLGVSPTEDYAWGIAAAGSYMYLAGHAASPAPLDMLDATLLKINSDGKLLQARTWGGRGEDTARGVAVSGDSVYLAGETASLGEGGQALLVKYTSPSGTINATGLLVRSLPLALFAWILLLFSRSVTRSPDGGLTFNGF